jgi:hypothetical protein
MEYMQVNFQGESNATNLTQTFFQPDSFKTLPSEVILFIISYLNVKELAIVARLNKRMKLLTENDVLWKSLSIKNLEIFKADPENTWKETYKICKTQGMERLRHKFKRIRTLNNLPE